MKTSIQTNVLIPAAFAILASTLSAQTTSSKSTSWDTIWGASNRRAYVQPVLRGNIFKQEQRTSTSRLSRMRYEAEGRFFGKAKLFYIKKSVIDIQASATLVEGKGLARMGYVAGTPTNHSASASLTMKLGGSVIFQGSRRTSGTLASFSQILTAWTARHTFYVCYIPITLRGSVSAHLGANLGTTLTLRPTSSTRMIGNSAIGLNGSGTGYIRATGAVMLGWSGLGAGFEAIFRFMETTLTVLVNGSRTGIDGSIEIRVQPMRLRLVVFAEAGGRVEEQIYSWRCPYVWRVPRTFR